MMKIMDGNEAAAHVSYGFTEVAGIYPITPASPMAELTDKWSSEGRMNFFDTPVKVIEMDNIGSEAFKHRLYFYSCLFGVNGFKGHFDFVNCRRSVKIHIGGVAFGAVADAVTLMLHTEVFNLVAERAEMRAKLRHICLRPAVRVEKFVDH